VKTQAELRTMTDDELVADALYSDGLMTEIVLRTFKKVIAIEEQLDGMTQWLGHILEDKEDPK